MSDTRSHSNSPVPSASTEQVPAPAAPDDAGKVQERAAPDPTRYGDWEKNGRCIDF